MKILQVLHGFPPELRGGTESTVEALSRAMQAQGHEMTVLAGSMQRSEQVELREDSLDGLRVLRIQRDDLYFENWDKAYSPALSARFASLLDELQPDLVHVHHWLRLSSDLLRIARAKGCRTAVTCHDYYSVLGRPLRGIGEDEAEAPPAIAGMSEEQRAQVFAFLCEDFIQELAAADLRYVPSAAHGRGLAELARGEIGDLLVSHPPMLAPPAEHPARETARGHRLLFWGSIYPEKGLGMVLDALNSIGGEWSLEVLGEAHDPAHARELELQAGIARVDFYGAFSREKLASMQADYAILPSMVHESYGLVLDEAQCLGLPVIAADLPAYREHAQADSTLFFAPADPGALAMLLLDEDRLQALASPKSPLLVSAESAAATLLKQYEAVLASSQDSAAEMPDRSRADELFAAAEQRYRGE
ncbi:MAG: glycosyltransferase [Planctomycetota bacterium]|jgi:glycosyltransferase involved in cell wall biosynthesis